MLGTPNTSQWKLALLAALWGQLLGIAHFLLVAHRPCFEHDDLLEASATSQTREAKNVLEETLPNAGAHRHDHCATLTVRSSLPELAACLSAPSVERVVFVV